MRPHVVVFGTGALGCLFAARLAGSGKAEVTLAGSWRAGLEAAARGITVIDDAGSTSTPVRTAIVDGALGPADVALVLVKAPHTAAVAAAAARSLAAAGVVVSLQNGLGHREVLRAAAGANRVAVGVATLGATLLAPATVRAFPGRVELGAEGAVASAVRRLAGLLSDAGIPTEVESDVERSVWRKLAVNCAINPLAALRGVTNGALLADPECRRVLEAAAREVGEVAAARGVRLEADPAALAREVAAATSRNRSSMLQDLERGAATEIDAVCGAVVREGRRLGVPTPVNGRLWRDVRRREEELGGLPAAAGDRR